MIGIGRIARGALMAGIGAATVFAQTRVSFEVATIRPSSPFSGIGSGHIGVRVDVSRVDIGSTPLLTLICNAYGLRPYQVSGPDWLKNTLFDIQATIPAGVPQDRVPDMIRALLEDRFALKVHHASQDQSVYALVVAKDGPKMRVSAPDAGNDSPPPADDKPAPNITVPTLQGAVKMTRDAQGIVLEMPGKEIRGKIHAAPVQAKGSEPKRLHLESSGMTMKSFAELLSVGVLDRPVVDTTGLTGGYEVAVDLSEFEAMGVLRTSLSFLPIGGEGGGRGDMGAAPDPSGSALRASIAKLGLNLEAKKLPLDLLVVDSIEKTPTEN